MNQRDVLLFACVCAAGLSTASFAGQKPPDYGLPWATVGAAGNDPITLSNFPDLRPRSVGGVDYEYRIMTREVTVGEWWEFLQTAAPHIESLGVGPSQIAGASFQWIGGGPNGPVWEPIQGLNEAAQVRWYDAAMYTNWLHNGKGSDISAFRDGAYDIATFDGPDGRPAPGQDTHHEGAQFWISTMDEWVKAAYYDPNRHGEGEGGYWLFPNGTDEQLRAGLPETGGQTNAGREKEWPEGEFAQRPRDVGSYPDVLSPWGLMDISGGAEEWLEDRLGGLSSSRLAKGTGGLLINSPLYIDHIDFFGRGSPSQYAGFRVASVIPAPSGACVVAGMGGALWRRRGR